MTRSTCSYRYVFVLVNQAQNSLAVVVETLANGRLNKPLSQAAINARLAGDGMSSDGK